MLLNKELFRQREICFPGYTLKIGQNSVIMGILNVTPDSFSDGGFFLETSKALEHALEMEAAGAQIIDIGGESSRPGYSEITAEEEISRILPVASAAVKELKIPLSIDTWRAATARKVLEIGAGSINDIWGLQRDPELASVIADFEVPVFIMHNRDSNAYDIDIIESIKQFFEKSLNIAAKAGIKNDKIILDPGIGFGKNPEQNYLVLARLDEIKALGYPVMLGTSRKSMIGKILDLPPDQRVNGTIATSVTGRLNGVDIFRVHDVKENLEALKITDYLIQTTIGKKESN